MLYYAASLLTVLSGSFWYLPCSITDLRGVPSCHERAFPPFFEPQLTDTFELLFITTLGADRPDDRMGGLRNRYLGCVLLTSQI